MSPSWVMRVMKGQPKGPWVSMERGTKVIQGLPWRWYFASFFLRLAERPPRPPVPPPRNG
jgi:hypothetical protein